MGTLGISSKVEESLSYIRKFTTARPGISIVLGTGLQSLIEVVEDAVVINYKDIPHFPVSTVQSHKGQLIFGQINGKDIVLVAGRFHYYEGYSMEQVTYYIHVLKALGIHTSIMNSASGGLNPHYKEGNLVMIKDHINMFPKSPLRGQNDESQGPRFPDMLNAYPKNLRSAALTCARSLNIDLKSGVYLGWQGPALETPAEYKMARGFGADLVGMSTVPEVIVNKYREINTLAFTIVSNLCFPISALEETTVESVIKTVNENAKQLKELIIRLIPEI